MAANEAELESIVVRILGDGSSFQTMMKQAVQSAQQSASAVQVAGQQIEQIRSGLVGFASTALTALSGYGMTTSLMGAFDKFSELERNTLKFNAVLEFNKRNVKETTDEYKRFTEQIMQVTTLSKGEIMSLLKRAETMGFTGAKAEQLAKASIGLGAASEMSAESAMSMVIALERGNTQMLRRIPALRGIHDQQQLVAKANELMNLGLKEEAALAQTAPVQLERLKKAFGGVTMEVGGLVSQALTPLVKMLTQAVDRFKALAPETRTYIAYVSGLVLVLLALPTMYSTLIFLLNATGVSFAFSTAMQLINLGAWLAWQAVVLAAQFTVGTFNVLWSFFNAALWATFVTIPFAILQWIGWIGAMVVWGVTLTMVKLVLLAYNLAVAVATTLWAAYTTAAGGATLGTLAYAAGALVGKAAVWLLNAALTVKNVLLAGIPMVIGLAVAAFTAFVAVVTASTGGVFAFIAALLALAATLLVLTAVAVPVVLLGTAVVILAVALWDVFNAVKSLPESLSAVNELTKGFMYWFGIVKDIIKAAQIDMPMAWEMVRLAAMLAVYQIRDAWPTLWQFIKSGFGTLFDFIAASMVLSFQRAFAELALLMADIPGFDKVFGAGAADQLRRWNGELKTAQEQVNRLAIAQAQAAAAALDFGADSPEARQARARLDELRGALRAKEEVEKAKKMGGDVGDGFNKGLGEHLHKLEPALYSSAEALARLNEWKDKLSKKPAGEQGPANAPAPGGIPGAVVVNNQPGKDVGAAFGGAVAAGNEQARVEKILADILEQLKNNPVMVIPAGFGQ